MYNNKKPKSTTSKNRIEENFLSMYLNYLLDDEDTDSPKDGSPKGGTPPEVPHSTTCYIRYAIESNTGVRLTLQATYDLIRDMKQKKELF